MDDDLTQLFGAGECHNPAEGEEPAHAQALLGLLFASREAMEDGPARDSLLLEDRKCLVPGLARVDYQGEIVLVSEGDLGGEDFALSLPRRVVIVEVEPALPYRHDARVRKTALRRRLADQCLQRFKPGLGVVRMKPDGREHLSRPSDGDLGLRPRLCRGQLFSEHNGPP